MEETYDTISIIKLILENLNKKLKLQVGIISYNIKVKNKMYLEEKLVSVIILDMVFGRKVQNIFKSFGRKFRILKFNNL